MKPQITKRYRNEALSQEQTFPRKFKLRSEDGPGRGRGRAIPPERQVLNGGGGGSCCCPGRADETRQQKWEGGMLYIRKRGSSPARSEEGWWRFQNQRLWVCLGARNKGIAVSRRREINVKEFWCFVDETVGDRDTWGHARQELSALGLDQILFIFTNYLGFTVISCFSFQRGVTCDNKIIIYFLQFMNSILHYLITNLNQLFFLN